MHRYTAVHKLMNAIMSPERIRWASPTPVPNDALLAVHDHDYVHRFRQGTLSKDEQRNIGFPWMPEFVQRTELITGATWGAMHDALALPGGVAANQAGGTHHAFPDHGEGFCIFNDLAVCAHGACHAPVDVSPGTPRIRRVVIIDLDVHQGNGTAACTARDPRIVTLSIQGQKQYPWDTARASTIDVEVPDGAGDEVYLACVERGLSHLSQYLAQHPPIPAEPHAGMAMHATLRSPQHVGADLVMFQAGVDPLTADRLGRLNVTRTGLHKRNAMVYRWVQAAQAPLVVTMGGGYARPIELSARAHVDVFQQAAQLSWDRCLHTVTE